jgi:hypothetical protein
MSYIYRKFAYFVLFVNFLVVFSIWGEYPTPGLRAAFWPVAGRLHLFGPYGCTPTGVPNFYLKDLNNGFLARQVSVG